MRLVYLLQGDEHSADADRWAGYIRYCLPAFEILLSRDVEIVFGTVRGTSPLHSLSQQLGCKTFTLECRSSLDYPRAAARLAGIFREEKIDVAHLVESIQSALGGLAAQMARETATVYHRHHVYLPGVQRPLTGLATLTCDVTMCVSKAVAAIAGRGWPRPSNLTTVHNGIQALESSQAAVSAIRQRLHAKEELIFVAVGHLREEKGFHHLLEAACALGPREDIRIVLIGDGPERPRLESLARAASLPVDLVGHQSNIADWMAAAHAVVVPSQRESFGLVALEAMSLKKPVIGTDVDGLSEVVVDGHTGVLVEAGRPDALVQAMLALVSDPDRAMALGQRGYRVHRDRFTVERMVDGWLDAYELAKVAKAPKS